MKPGEKIALTLGLAGLGYWFYNRPKLSFEWVDNTHLKFTLSKGGRSRSGIIDTHDPQNLTVDTQLVDGYGFTVVVEAIQITFTISKPGAQTMDNIFSQVVPQRTPIMV